jgi:hypothetical protein
MMHDDRRRVRAGSPQGHPLVRGGSRSVAPGTDGYRARMAGRRPTTRRNAQQRAEREREHGLDPDDEAGRWLAEHDPRPEPEPPKAARKSKELHRFRQRQQREGR